MGVGDQIFDIFEKSGGQIMRALIFTDIVDAVSNDIVVFIAFIKGYCVSIAFALLSEHVIKCNFFKWL